MLLGSLLLTAFMVIMASRISTTMQTSDLLPAKDKRVVQFNKIIDEFSTATNLTIVVQGEEQKIKSFADDLAPRILTLIDTTHNEKFRKKIGACEEELMQLRAKAGKQDRITELEDEIRRMRKRIDMTLFQRVDYKVEQDFLRRHGLMLVKADDLRKTGTIFTDPNLVGLLTNLNDALEAEYVGDEESISTREKEDGAFQFLDGIENLIGELDRTAAGSVPTEVQIGKAVDKLILGEPYMLSYDKTALILIAVPNFTLMDRDLIMVSNGAVQEEVDRLLENHPGVTAGLSGSIAREHDEQVYSEQSLGTTTLIAFGAILILLIIAFRMWVAPVLAMVNLAVGLIWAVGAAYLAVGQLNMVTSVMSVVLLGLGIDFSIHLISAFTEWRAAGDSISLAMEKTFLKSGKGIITGALTTACAFLTLLISQTRGMREMGIVTGLGLLSILTATLLFLPVLLVFRERIREKVWKRKNKPVVRRDISFQALGRSGTFLSRHYRWTLIIVLMVSGILIWAALQLKYDQNYLNLEPKGLKSIALMDTVIDKFDLNMEYSLCLTGSVEESRDLADKFRDRGTVAITSDISLYIPSPADQAERTALLDEIRGKMRGTKIRHGVQVSEWPELAAQLDRLGMNVIEIQDLAFNGGQDKVFEKCLRMVGDTLRPELPNIFRNLIAKIDADVSGALRGVSAFQKRFAPAYRSTVLRMSSSESIGLEDLPESVLDQYSNRSRDLFLITIYPKGNLFEDGELMARYAEDLDRISEKTTGTLSLGVALIRIFARDGRNAILLTLVIVFLLLWLDFSSPKLAFMAMIPLIFGIFWMAGFMQISGMMITFMNLIGLPMIIGIGIDDGVHIIHRWQAEGPGKCRIVFASTGKAILLTSLTTMLAFGSMVFSVFPAWASLGSALFIGVGACFITTVLFLPGFIGWLENRNNKPGK
jgi:predicted RND superfamily exporter protein